MSRPKSQVWGTLSPVVGFIECRRLYGKLRLVIPWQSRRRGVHEVYLDVEGVEAMIAAAEQNAGHSARRGPLSVRRTPDGRRRH